MVTFKSYKNLKLVGCKHAFSTAQAKSVAPLPPKKQDRCQ